MQSNYSLKLIPNTDFLCNSSNGKINVSNAIFEGKQQLTNDGMNHKIRFKDSHYLTTFAFLGNLQY